MEKEFKEKRLTISRRVLEFWTLFIGIGAVAGAVGMFVDISGKTLGMDEMLPYFQVLPFADVLFQNFLFSGIMLLIINGLTNLTAYVFMLAKKPVGYYLGAIFGFTLTLWIIIQFVIFPLNFMSTIYFIFGLLQLIQGIICIVFYKQTLFKFDENDYKNIQKQAEIAVVYFSRMGYSKKIAYELANENNAEIIELKTPEKTDMTTGFWWCGRFAMHKWGMNLEKLPETFEKHTKIIIVSPVWMFSICSPVRELIKTYGQQLKNVTFVTNCFSIYNKKQIQAETKQYMPNAEIEYRFYTTKTGKQKRIS